MFKWICAGLGLIIVAGLAVYALSMRHPMPVSPLFRDVSVALADGSTVLDARTADLDSNKSPEVIAITCHRRDGSHPMGGDIVVLRQSGGKLKLLWKQPDLNPWKLQVGDVDGDGRPEVVAGVWKKSRFDRVMAKRTFVFYWNGKRLCPKWLSSRLSRRFDDFTTADVDNDGRTEIVAMEITQDASHRLSVYRWKSFGCEWAGCSRNIKGLESVDTEDNKVITRGKGGTFVLQYRDGKVSLSEEISRHDR